MGLQCIPGGEKLGSKRPSQNTRKTEVAFSLRKERNLSLLQTGTLEENARYVRGIGSPVQVLLLLTKECFGQICCCEVYTKRVSIDCSELVNHITSRNDHRCSIPH